MSTLKFLTILSLFLLTDSSQNETNKAVCDELREEMNALKEQVDLLKRGMIERERRQAQAYAFTAYLDHSQAVHTGNVMKFNQVLFSEGGMYNPLTGIATIKVSGTYLFTFTIEHWQSTPLATYLMVDGVNQVDAVFDPNGRSAQSSNTAIIGLQRGQSVWVETKEGTLWGEPNFRATTFSGSLMYFP